MFHKTEELLSGRTDSEMDEMDTSDTQWGWFYLAECGKWHMFQVSPVLECSTRVEIDLSPSSALNPKEADGPRPGPHWCRREGAEVPASAGLPGFLQM